MVSKIFGLGLLLFFLSMPAQAMGPKKSENRSDSAPLILNTFQNGCSSVGTWTGAARAQSNSLIDILNVLKNTAACDRFKDQLDRIKYLSVQIDAVLAEESYIAYRKTQESLQETLLALDTATANPASSTELIDSLKAKVVELQVGLATARGDRKAYLETERRDRYAKHSEHLAGFVSELLASSSTLGLGTSSPSLHDCLKQSPAYAPLQIATNVLSIAGSFISPTVGASSAVIGTLINSALTQFRVSEYDSIRWDLQADQMPLAIECGLQSMSELYCQAGDSYRLLELRAMNYDSKAEPHPLWKGFDLLGRRLQVFTRWLDSVKNGIPPSDPTQASRQVSARRQIYLVEVYGLEFTGMINQAISFYRDATKIEEKKRYIYNLISSMAVSLGKMPSIGVQPGVSISPFSTYEPNPFRWACWIVHGREDSCKAVPDVDSNTSEPKIQDYVKKDLLPTVTDASVNLLLNNWLLFVEKVHAFTSIEFAKTITTNAPALLSAAFQTSGGNLSPRGVLGRVLQFLEEMKRNDDGSNPRLPALIDAKLESVRRSIWYLDGADDATFDWNQNGSIEAQERLCPLKESTPVAGSPPVYSVMTSEECSQFRLMKLFNLFRLSDGVQVFYTDVNYFVTWDMQRRMKHGEVPKDILDILRTAGVEIDIIFRAAGFDEPEKVKGDLNNSRRQSLNNLKSFREMMNTPFIGAVERLSREIAREGSVGGDRPSGEQLGRLCTLWLATNVEPGAPNWPNETVAQVCGAAKIYPVKEKKDAAGTPLPSIDLKRLEAELKGKEISYRACAYHRFLRANRLAELLDPVKTMGERDWMQRLLDRIGGRSLEVRFSELPEFYREMVGI